MKISDKLLRRLIRIYHRTNLLYITGNYDKALKYFEENENQFENLPKEQQKEAEQLHCQSLMLIAIIFSYRGDLNRYFEVVIKILKIAEEIDDKYCLLLAMYGYGRYYWLSGDLIQALKYFDLAIELGQDIDDPERYMYFLSLIMMAIRVAVMKGDLEIAREYYKQVEISEEDKNKSLLTSLNHKRMYDMSKALILKSSNRFRDRAMAQELFKEIFEDETFLLNNRH